MVTYLDSGFHRNIFWHNVEQKRSLYSIDMNIELIKKEDVSQNYGKYGKNTRRKRCGKCGTRKTDLDLTELTDKFGRLNKYFLCDECNQIKE